MVTKSMYKNEKIKNFQAECILCNGKKFEFVTSLKGKQFKRNASIYSCSFCGLGITYPGPKNVDFEYYAQTTQDLKEDIKQDITLDYIYKDMAKLFYQDYKREMPIKILDFGCGRGDLLRNFKNLYPNSIIYGIEASSINQEKYLKKYDFKIFDSLEELKSVKSFSNYFDIIAISSVLEHIKDFPDLIHIFKEMKKTTGHILVSQAIYRALLPKLLPFAWYGWQPQEHFYHFSEQTLQFLSKKYCLSIERYQKKALHQPFSRGKSKTRKFAQMIVFIISKLGMLIGKGDLHNVIYK